ELVVHEVQRPARVRPGLDQDRSPRAHRASPRPALAHRQPFLAVEPVDAVDAGWLTLPPEQDEQSPVAEAPALIGKLTQPAAQFRLRRPAGPVAHHLAIGTDNGAGPTLRQAHGGPQMRDGFAPGGGSYHFFVKSSRSAEASSIWSASSRFSFAFSSSSAFSRLASETSIPPYLAFQLMGWTALPSRPRL